MRPLSLTCQRGQTMPSGKWHPAGFAESTTKTLLSTVRRARFSARRALLCMRPRALLCTKVEARVGDVNVTNATPRATAARCMHV